MVYKPIKRNVNNKITKDDIRKNKIETILQEDETMLWNGKPNKVSYAFTSIIRLLPFTLFWLIVDVLTIVGLSFISNNSLFICLLVIFIGIQCIPAFIFVHKIMLVCMEYKVIRYAITDKRIILRDGEFGVNFKCIDFDQIKDCSLNKGITDSIEKTGDIYINGDYQKIVFYDVEHPNTVYNYIVSELNKIQEKKTKKNTKKQTKEKC